MLAVGARVRVSEVESDAGARVRFAAALRVMVRVVRRTSRLARELVSECRER